MARRGRMPMDVSDAIKLLETKPARGAAYSVPTREAVRMVLRDRAIMEKSAETHRRLGSMAADALSLARRELADLQDQQAIRIEAARREAVDAFVAQANADRLSLKAELFSLVAAAYRATAGLAEGVAVVVALVQKGSQAKAEGACSISAWEATVSAPVATKFGASGPTTMDAIRALLAALRSWSQCQSTLHHDRFLVTEQALTRAAELLDGTARA